MRPEVVEPDTVAVSGLTTWVHPDEPAYGLMELTEVFPPKYKRRRYQMLYVLRDGEIALHLTDLGPAEMFPSADQLRFPAEWELTVGELWDMAEKKRGDDYWTKRAEEIAAESTLGKDWLDYQETLQKVKNRQTVIGPGIWQQRNW